MAVRAWLSAILILLSLPLVGADSTYLKIGRVAFSQPERILISHNPLCLHIKKEVGLADFEMFLYESYEELFERLKAGDVQLAWLGTAFYAMLNEPDIEPIVRPLWIGRKSYRGQWFALKENSMNSLQDLRGKRVAFVSPKSSSGYLFPKMLLEKRGILLEDLSEYSFLDKHSAVVASVLTRQFDAGASYVGIFQEKAFVENANKFQVLEQTDEISNEPIVVRSDFPKDLKEKLRNAFLSAQSSGAVSSIRNLTGFVRAISSDYDAVRKLVADDE